MRIVFNSTRDPISWICFGLWVVLISVGMPLAMLYLVTGTSEPALLVVFLALSAVGVFGLWIHFGTWYGIDERTLTVRCGPWRWRILVEAIEDVAPSREIVSAPALSLDRLKIMHRESAYGLLVSPKDREGFLAALQRVSPQLQRRGTGLCRP